MKRIQIKSNFTKKFQRLALTVASLTLFMSVNSAPTFAADYASQYTRAIQGMLANLFSNGAVIASPSQSDPNYYLDWVRDTALTMKTVVQLQQDPTTPAALREQLTKQISVWIQFEMGLQTTPKQTDLGEPRFYINGQANNEPWGRPQNDGPALRALTAIMIANGWIAQGRFDDVRSVLYRNEIPAQTLIKRDLEYVAHHWIETSVDLWEEERAMHFYTLTVQKVALMKGSDLARKMGDTDAANFYKTAASQIEQYLAAFVDAKRGVIHYALNKTAPLPHKKSDLDVAVLLAAIQTFDGQFYVPIQPMVQTVNQIAQTFQSIYTINQIQTSSTGLPLGIALGRYEDDHYTGYNTDGRGNPWFIATLALAEFSCDLARAKTFPANYKSQLSETAMKQFNRVMFHLPADGSMAEQINRENGYTQGARDLTWSYASYITAYRACFR